MKTVTTMPDTGQLELPIGEFVDPGDLPGATNREKFEAYHKANRWVYHALVMLTEDWIEQGNRHCSVDMLCHVLRFQYSRQTVGGVGRFKINNNNTAFYARKLIDEHPEWAGIFTLREQRTP